MSKFFSQKHSELIAYTPGEQPKDRRYIKLNTNESPFPPSPFVIDAVKRAAENLQLYCDPETTALHNALAEYYGVERKNVITGNGSDEVLNFAVMAFCDENTPLIFPEITYGFYSVFAKVNGVPYETVALKDDFTVDVDGFLNKNGTIVIANPNAPTGIALTLDEIEKIVRSNANNVVIIDEAYVDFGGESAVELTKKYENLLVVQTFSKSRSLAGGRLGFGIASEGLINDLTTMKYSTNPYNVNSMTQAAGLAAITDTAYFEKNVQTIIKNREYTREELVKRGFESLDSKTNFVFAKKQGVDGEKLYLALKEKGVLVRHFKNEKIKDFNRITIGTKAQMTALIQAIDEILSEGEQV